VDRKTPKGLLQAQRVGIHGDDFRALRRIRARPYNRAMKEGFLGGVLSTSWPLLQLQKKQPNLKYSEGKLDGRNVHALEYRPKKSDRDLRIKLFFDFDTYHHLRTEYQVRVKGDLSAMRSGSVRHSSLDAPGGAGDLGGKATIMDNTPESIYQLVEKFDNFREIGGITIPYNYSLKYSVEGNGPSFVANWNLRASGKFANNGQISPEFFKAQK
jgi:hypothetical protein